jgi:hypothetical protein
VSAQKITAAVDRFAKTFKLAQFDSIAPFAKLIFCLKLFESLDDMFPQPVL